MVVVVVVVVVPVAAYHRYCHFRNAAARFESFSGDVNFWGANFPFLNEAVSSADRKAVIRTHAAVVF